MALRASSVPFVALLAALSVAELGHAQPAADGLAPYRATYGLYNGEKRVGDSVFSLQYDAATERYVFETRSEFRGLLRLLSPRPVVEHSEFTVSDGRIRPLSFAYEDGSRGGRRNIRVSFDWAGGRVLAESDDGQREWPLPDGSLDRASARVALMRDLARSVDRDVYRIADPDEVSAYALSREGSEMLTTPLGVLGTVKVAQQRSGSSRRTVTWAAPSLRYLAVRIEQQREDRDAVAFVLESVEWADTARGARSR